jgi:transglutaminase-like putative cysteine protease
VPVITDYNNMIIHQFQLDELTGTKAHFSYSFLVNSYSFGTQINANAVLDYSAATRALYSAETAGDDLIPSDPRISSLASSIVGGEVNPYRTARRVYDYLLDSYVLRPLRPAQSDDPYALLDSGVGDSYDFALVYAALLRALNIPAVPVAGILVDAKGNARNHWWCEFYIERFGWVPVDPALGAGMDFTPYGRKPDSERDYYFGSIDSSHIAFSWGWKAVKPAFLQSKTVYRARSYAFQSIWEESAAVSGAYRSVWDAPSVTVAAINAPLP